MHRLATAMTREPVHAHPDVSNLFHGAPAVAYTLRAAGLPGYRTALATLDRSSTRLIQLRLRAAHRRMDDRLLAQAREYDLINGITGLGPPAALLRGVGNSAPSDTDLPATTSQHASSTRSLNGTPTAPPIPN